MYGYYLRCADALVEKGVYLTSRVVPGGEHCEASWERQIPFFLPTLMYEADDWNRDDGDTEDGEE